MAQKLLYRCVVEIKITNSSTIYLATFIIKFTKLLCCVENCYKKVNHNF